MTTRQKQDLLDYLGYPCTNDGAEGPQTRGALADFTRDYGAGEEGLPDAVSGKIGKKRDFWADIRYFTREEFRCKCGGRYCSGYPAQPQEALVRMADTIRNHFGVPARVVSGLRCSKWNAIQGGVSASRHMTGQACDLYIPGIPGETLLSYIKTLPGLRYAYHIPGSENVHFDV